MSCTTCREPNDPHWPAYHSCLAALERRLADRIAKLEARLDDKCGLCGGPNGRSSEHICRKSPTFDQLVAKVGPLASTGLASAESPPAAAGPVPPGYKLAPGWSLARPPYAHCLRYYHDGQGRYCGSDGVIECGNARICVRHAIDKAAIVKVEPPAETGAVTCGRCGADNVGRTTCGACGYCWQVVDVTPAEQPASAAVETSVECGSAGPDDVTCCRDVGHDGPCTQACDRDEFPVYWHKPPAPAQGAPAAPLSKDINGWATHARVQELEARIAAAEWERDEAVAAERERCLAHIETYDPRREAPTDWTYQGALSRITDAIRDGRPVPK